MKRTACPYLGLKDDPTTMLNFPSEEGNHCHNARPVSPVRLAHQQKYCLTSGHTHCPIYQAAQPKAMPAALVAHVPSQTQRRPWVMLGIPLLALGMAALWFSWIFFGGRFLGERVGLIPETGNGDEGEAPSFELFDFRPDPTITPYYAADENTGQPQPRIADCSLPQGWFSYIANPTDSLFRLSVVYEISVDELQQANCMGDSTVVLPGQVLYVPFLPTSEPSGGSILDIFNAPTATATVRSRPAATEEIVSGSGEEDNNPKPAAPRPTNTRRAAAPTATSGGPVIPATVAPTNTLAPLPTATNAPPATATTAPPVRPTRPRPTATNPPPTATNPPPTNTSAPPTVAPPTSVPPTNTPWWPWPRPTATDVPPTAAPPTSVPPTATDAPPPPTATDEPPPPPTATDAPPPPPTDPPPPPPTEAPPPPPPTDPPPVATEAPPPPATEAPATSEAPATPELPLDPILTLLPL